MKKRIILAVPVIFIVFIPFLVYFLFFGSKVYFGKNTVFSSVETAGLINVINSCSKEGNDSVSVEAVFAIRLILILNYLLQEMNLIMNYLYLVALNMLFK